MSEKTEEELIGTLVKLKKRDNGISTAIDKLLDHRGDFYNALERKHGDWNDPERWYKAIMSINPDRIIELAEQLRKLQKEYEIAHKELKNLKVNIKTLFRNMGIDNLLIDKLFTAYSLHKSSKLKQEYEVSLRIEAMHRGLKML
jgi:uncharacterized protein YrrD